MSVRSLLAIVAIAVAGVAAILWTQSRDADQSTGAAPSDKLLPELQEQIEKLSAVTIVEAGDKTVATLQRGASGWSVLEKQGYPANGETLAELLRALADARRVEQKTSNPELYDRLGVEDVADEAAAGVRIELSGLDSPYGIIVGNTNPDAGSVTYVRFNDQTTSWAVDKDIVPSTDVLAWVDAEVMDLAEDRVSRVVIRHPDGETLTINRESADSEEFSVEGVPEGRELASEWEAQAIAGALAGLQLDDVLPASEEPSADQDWLQVEFQTFDGLVVAAELKKDEERNLLRLKSSFQPEVAEADTGNDQAEGVTSVDQENTAVGADKQADGETSTEQKSTVAAEVDELNPRLQPWVFVVGSYTADNLSKRLEDMLKPLEEPESAELPSAPADPATESE